MPLGIRADAGGRVPFSLVAVIALLLAGVSSAVVAITSRDAAQAALQEEQLRALGAVAAAVHEGVELEAHALALEAIRIASQSPASPDRTNREFARLLRERLEPSFPRSVHGFTIELGGLSAALFLERRQTLDLVPARSVPGHRESWTSETLSADRPAVLGEASRPPYFTMVGSVNYTVRRDGVSVRMRLPLQRVIESPFPLLQATVREFRGAADGSESDVARILQYILTTAAQYRALQGYAAGRFGEPGTTTADLLTPRDIEVAVNLALLLEQLRRFRSFDEGSARALDAAFFEGLAGRYLGDPRVPDAAGRTIVRLLDAYAKGGTTDPADLFALYNAFDADPVRLNRVLAQALSGIVDQYVLRVFEYFGLEPGLDLGVRGAEALARSIDEFLSWIEGGRREADLVRAFVRELFGMAGEPLTFLGATSVAMPERSYAVTNADGTAYTISIPAHEAPVAFEEVAFLSGHDDVWRSYYDTLFTDDLKAVHASAREFLTDLATTVANNLNLIGAIPNPALRGRIDPQDDASIPDFAQGSLTSASDDAVRRIREDPSYIGSLVANLWKAQAAAVRGAIDVLAANYDVLVAGGDEVALARTRLALHLEDMAASDADYGSLDPQALADLRGQIQQEADGPWVLVAYAQTKGVDLARLEGIYDDATAASTPPSEGGIYRRLVETVVGTTGFLVAAGDLIRAFGAALTASDDVRNVKILVPNPEGPFELWTGDRTAAIAGHRIRHEAVVCRQTPSILRVTRPGDPGAWSLFGPEPGDLWVGLRDPTTVPRNRASPNVHWTDIHEMSSRPFEARWDLRVLGLFHLDAMSARGVRLGSSGHVPEVASMDVLLDFSLAIPVYTGWPLQGVAYRASATLAGDTWTKIVEIVGGFWDQFLGPIVDRILDMIHGFIEALLDPVRRVMDSEVVRALGEIARVTLDALQDFVLRMLGPLAPAVEALILIVQNADLSFETLGIDVTVGPGSKPMSVELTGLRDDVEMSATLMLRGFDPHN